MKSLFVLSLLLGCFHSMAQNVGIGTTTPSFKLDVRVGSINTDSLYRIDHLPVLSTKGTGNLFVGDNAGRLTTGQGNTFVGDTSGLNNTTGHSNTAVGTLTLTSNTTGIYNTALGHRSLVSNTTGVSNTGLGAFTLTLNETGLSNIAVGDGALMQNTSGSYNFGAGIAAMAANSTGYGNTGVGYSVLGGNTTGTYNTALGTSSLLNNITGSYNTVVGFSANTGVGTFDNATAIGARAMVSASNAMVLGSINGVNGATASTKVGIGITNPGSALHVASIDGSVATFDGPAGMYLVLRETGTYRGYIGSFAGNAADVDFGTGAGNTTGRVHLTLQASPALTIEATGNVNLYDNELNRTLKTGNANLVPIAYGNISSTGFVQASSGNVTVIADGIVGYYNIEIAGEDYQFQQYITVVTPIGSTAPVIATTGSGDGKLQVYLYTITGADVDQNFHFVVYKP
jgi:hypothetical protein